MTQLRVLTIIMLVVALLGWATLRGYLAGQNALAANQSFAVALPVMLHVDAGQLLSAPQQPVADTTDTPTATPSATSTATPTITPSATPTNSPDCDLDIEQNLDGRLRSDSVGEVSNSSDHCAYAIGLASYRMLDDRLSHQQLFSSQAAIIGPGEALTLTVDLPDCAYQVDLFHGPLIEAFDPGRGLVYGERILDMRVRRTGFCPPGSTPPAATATGSPTLVGSPTPTATATPSTTAVGSPTPTDTPSPTPDGGS